MRTRRRPKYVYDNKAAPDGSARRRRRSRTPGIILIMLAAFIMAASLFLRDLSTQIAVSDACDLVTISVNRAVTELISEGGYDYDYFVTLEKNAAGEAVAMSCNMGRINTFASQILDRVVGYTENGEITVSVPLGNLTGSNLLLGRGPDVPIRLMYLTSSTVNFSNELITAGINQTNHQLNLEVTVDVDILIPWGTATTKVVTDILIADTVIVGQVPQTYLNME